MINSKFEVLVDKVHTSQEYSFVSLNILINKIKIGSGCFVDIRLMIEQIKTLIDNIESQSQLKISYDPVIFDLNSQDIMSKIYFINGKEIYFYQLFSGIPLETEAFDGDKVFLFNNYEGKNLYFKEYGSDVFCSVKIDFGDYLLEWSKVLDYLVSI